MAPPSLMPRPNTVIASRRRVIADARSAPNLARTVLYQSSPSHSQRQCLCESGKKLWRGEVVGKITTRHHLLFSGPRPLCREQRRGIQTREGEQRMLSGALNAAHSWRMAAAGPHQCQDGTFESRPARRRRCRSSWTGQQRCEVARPRMRRFPQRRNPAAVPLRPLMS